MVNHDRFDHHLSELTDALMEGRLPAAPLPEIESEERIVRGLYNIIARDQSIDTAFRSRLTHTLNEEWERAQSQKRHPNRLPFQLQRLKPFQVLAAAAAFILVFMAFVVSNGSDSLSGSAADTNGDSMGLIIALSVVIAIGLTISFVYYFLNRRN